MTISEIKKAAKTRLTGSYIKCATCTLLYFIVIFALTYVQRFLSNSVGNWVIATIIEAIFMILSLIIGYALIANIIRLADVKTNAVTDFINLTIKNTTKYIKTLLHILIKILIPLVLFILSGFYLIGNIASYVNKVNFLCFSQNLVPLATIVFVATLIVIIYFLLKYALVPYIYYSHPEMKPKEIVEKSNELMKGKKMQFLLLLLSFLNWFFIAAIIMFILNYFIPTEYLTNFVILFYSILKPYIVISKLGFYESFGE